MSRPLRLLTIIGARPQIIKAAALGRAIEATDGRIVETILHTGQHYDANMSGTFFEELGIASADINLEVGSGAQGASTARMIEGIEKVLLRKEHDMVVLYGDTNSTLAGAVAASKLQVPIVHIEAGLRSYDKSMPEELNRIITDHCSTWLFCPTLAAVADLKKEGIVSVQAGIPNLDHPAVVHCGDVMYDNSMYFAQKAFERSTILEDLGLEAGYILSTVHRQSNTDNAENLNAIFRALYALHTEHGLPIVLPLHPRTRKMMDAYLEPSLLKAIQGSATFHVIEPVGFLDMIALESNAGVVLTDSGGVQKEAFFFKRPVVVLRDSTEWVELVEAGQAVLVGTDEQRIIEATMRFIQQGVPESPMFYGDGHAAEKICNELLRHW